MTSDDLTLRAKEFDPWWFKFEKDGVAFGGDIDRDTVKTEMLCDWMRKLDLPFTSVMEFGAHEGSHSLQLAQHPGMQRVVAIEGRADNFARSQFVKSVFDQQNIEQHNQNLENFDPDQWDPCDAVFCAGLLYHLPEPWDLIEKIGKVAKHGLLLDTHYAPAGHETHHGRKGVWFSEGDDPLSGLSSRSFWMTFKDLILELLKNGFVVRAVQDIDTHSGPRIQLFAEKASGTVVQAG